LTTFIPKEKLEEIKSSLKKCLEEKYPEYVNKISIKLDQKLELIEVEPGLYMLSEEDAKLFREEKIK
jgi:hypothetical protein